MVIETDAIQKLGCGFLFLVTMAISVAVCEIFSVAEWYDLEKQGYGSFKIIGNGSI